MPGSRKIKYEDLAEWYNGISEQLIELLDDFARCKNVTIKEICEGAIVQFLSKYGYKNEIDMLFHSKE